MSPHLRVLHRCPPPRMVANDREPPSPSEAIYLLYGAVAAYFVVRLLMSVIV